MACLWEAHVRTMQRPQVARWLTLWHITRRGLFNLLVYIPWTFVVSVPAIIAVPNYSCYTDRARVSEVLILASDLRNTIADNVRQTKTLDHAGTDLTVPLKGRVVGGMVSDTGTIFMVTEDPPAVIRLTHSISDAGKGTVKWACLGFPTRAMPAQCRE